MAAIELPRSSMPLSPEVYESGRALSNYFCNTRKSDHLSSGISLFSLFHLKVMNILASCTQYDSTFFKTMAGYFSEEKDGPISAIFSVFTKSVYADRFTSTYFNSSGTIYCFYRILSNASQKTDSGKNDCSDLIEFIEYIQGYFIANQDDQLSQGLLDFINFCDLSIELLKHNDFELLDKAPIDFGVQAEEIPSDFHYRCSVRNFIYLFSTIHHLLLFLKMEQQINSPFKNNGESINQFLNAQYIATRRELLQNTSIPYQFQVRLYLVLRRSFHRLLKTDYNLEAMKKRFFSPGTLKYYSDTLCSKEAQKISKATVLEQGESLPPEALLNKDVFILDAAELRYATVHRDVYHNFPARLKELLNYFKTASAQANKDLMFLQELSLFIQFGDISKLQELLDKAPQNTDRTDAIAQKEVQRFRKLRQSGELMEKTAPNLDRQGKKQNLVNAHYQELEELWTISPSVLDTLLRTQVKFAKKMSQHLFVELPPSPPSHRSHRTSSQLIISEPAPSSQEPEEPLAEVQQTSSSSASADTTPTFNKQIENCRSALKNWTGRLSKDRHIITREAIENAGLHFDDLLCSMRRLNTISTRAPLTRSQIFSCVNDCIRHCTLGVEQVLSALYRDTKEIKTQEQLAPHLTHNLFYLLQNCNMDSGDLSRKIRRWISEINQGEIIIRDLTQIKDGENTLNTLLREALLLTSTSTDAQAVAKALLHYLTPLGELLDSIQHRFPKKGKLPPVPLENPIAALCQTFCENLSSYPLLQETPLPDPITRNLISDLQNHLQKFQSRASSLEISARLHNVENNLVRHLETELHSHQDLEPIEVSLHLGNVLLLNQIIAEKILIDALHAKGIDLTYEEETQHDLWTLYQKLDIKIPLSPNEISFLKTGNASRQLIRYPTSLYQQPLDAPVKASRSRSRRGVKQTTKPAPSRYDLIKAMLAWGRTLSSKQSASDDLKGFTSSSRPEAKKLEEIKSFAAKDIGLLNAIIAKVELI